MTKHTMLNEQKVKSELAMLAESEERFKNMFHGHSAAKMIIDPGSGTIIDANEAAANFYGWPVHQLRQMRIQDINVLPPEDVAAQMEKAASASSVKFEFRHRRADGSVMDVEVFSNKVDAAGKSFLYSIIHDVSDRKRAEVELKENENRLRRAEEFARFGHWHLSLADNVIHASEGALKVYGFASNDIPFSAVQQCALEEYRPILARALRDLIDKNHPYDNEYMIKKASDGTIVDVHSKAEYDPVNKTVFGVVQDITDHKRIEREREKLILELQNAIEHIKTLKGIVPICSHCKKVRDDKGYWEQVEAYVARHTDARFSHGICPHCAEELYPDSVKRMNEKRRVE